MEKIDRIEAPTADFFRENYLMPNKPVVMTGITDEWPAIQKWNQEYLTGLSGERKLSVTSMVNGDYVGSSNIDLTMDDFFDAMKTAMDSNRRLYLGELPISQYIPELLEDIKPPDFFDETESSPACFLYAGQDVFSQLHYHTFGSALLSPIRGCKKVRLYAPDQTPNLYKYPWYTKNNNMSRTVSLNPSETEFPRFAKADYLDIELCQGESMFIPIYWWHGITNEEFNIAVVIFWGEKLFRRLPPTSLAIDYLWDLAKDSPEIAAGILRKFFRSDGSSVRNDRT